MISLLIWLNIVASLSYFISDGEYLNNFRIKLEESQFKFKRFVGPLRLLSNIVDCGLCTSFYLGIILSGVILSPSKFLFNYDNVFLNMFADGMISIVYGIVFRILLSIFSYINFKK